MITGSAARNPEELGPGFLNIHKTLMSLYSALHQGMSAIYIMLPLRSVTASLSLSLSLSLPRSLTLSLSLSLAPALFFDMISFHKGPQSTAFSLLPLSLFSPMNACTFNQCHGIEGKRERGRKRKREGSKD